MLELYILSIVITLFFALGLNVVISRNPVYSILYLVLFFITGSSFLALFGFDYLALIFVLVYVGAIAVLFLFVIMILDIKIVNQSGFDATFLVLLSLILFGFPLLYSIGEVLLALHCGFCQNLPGLPLIGFLGQYDVTSLSNNEASTLLLDSGAYQLCKLVSLAQFNQFEELLAKAELFLAYKGGLFNSLILLKFAFCEHGFKAPLFESFLYDSTNTLKIDYDSSVKNFQILYTDFTALFLISGGVLLVAMTSCISLALPSQQSLPGKLIGRRFKRG